MIKEIKFIQYKKLEDISLTFKEGLNAIFGENGTCKSFLTFVFERINFVSPVTDKYIL